MRVAPGTPARDDTPGGAAPSSALVAGAVIDGKYQLERVIGEGGMGAVWRAHHLQLDMPVAIKVLRTGPDQETLSARLKIEAQAAARLTHPAIVRVFDVDITDNQDPYIVMELLQGESLWDVLERGPLPGVKAVQMLLPIAEALALAHAKGIAHRDLKPHNIFIAVEGGRTQPKLLDFGVAKLMTSPMPSGSLTSTGVLIGSPDYMSPEQARGRSDVDFRADIWQFCVVLYESLTTHTPFNGDNYNALLRAIVEDEPAPLPLDDDTDERLVALIAWGLRKDRNERPESMQTLGRSLAEWLVARGVLEDTSGGALSSKWLGPSSQLPTASTLPAPPAVTREGTLVSARRPGSAKSLAAPAAASDASSHPRVIIYALGLLLGAIACVVWLLARSEPSESQPHAAPTASSPSPARTVVVEAAPAQPVSIPSVEIGGTLEAEANALPDGEPPSGANSAPPVASGSATAAARPRKPPPAAKPGRDVKDETHELLQAY